MERLTTPGGECINMGEPCCPDENCADACLLMHLELANEHLAAYEEKGVEPEDILSGLELAEVHSAIRRLKQYEALGTIDDLTALVKARKDGRVVVLPCKVGDTVWNIKFVFSYYSEPKEEVVDRFVISRDGVDAVFKSGYKFSIERFGKTVFLTRAEAEAALKGASDV